MKIQKLEKRSFSLWLLHSTRTITINADRKQWKPRIQFHENKGRRKNNDSCFDCSLIIGTIIFGYTNWNLQNKKYEKRLTTGSILTEGRLQTPGISGPSVSQDHVNLNGTSNAV